MLRGVRRGLLNAAFQRDTGRVMGRRMGASYPPSPAGPEREEMSGAGFWSELGEDHYAGGGVGVVGVVGGIGG